MGRETTISWTDATWNPIRGCSRVSEGCRHCYAEGVAYRFSGPGGAYEGLVRIGSDGKRRREWNGTVRFVEEHLLDPLKWKEPKRVFVNSMSDLFHENVQDGWIAKIFAVMDECPRHTFQILTKRATHMAETIRDIGTHHDEVLSQARKELGLRPKATGRWPLPNVHLGVSVEDQAAVDERIPLLLRTPAAVRFISAEPLLGPIEISAQRIPLLWNRGLHWVIVGGESGPGARPMHPDWARSLRDQCQAASVPFFFKQWGEWTPGENVERNTGVVHGATWVNGAWMFDREDLSRDDAHCDNEPDLYRIGKKASGNLLDGREWMEFPQ